MRVGFFSDIHGNPFALDACLVKLAKMALDEIFFLGDAVGYLPGEKEVIDLLERDGIQCQQGNHEEMMLSPTPIAIEREEIYRLQTARSRLDEIVINRIASWPQFREIEISNQRILLVHGSPNSFLYGYVYPDTDLSFFDNISYDAIFMGNTHCPFVNHRGKKLFANVGSVGLSRDQGNLASFAIYDSNKHSCQIFRVQFDSSHVIAKYGNEVDKSVIACLRRKSSEIIGELV